MGQQAQQPIKGDFNRFQEFQGPAQGQLQPQFPQQGGPQSLVNILQGQQQGFFGPAMPGMFPPTPNFNPQNFNPGAQATGSGPRAGLFNDFGNQVRTSNLGAAQAAATARMLKSIALK